MAHGRLANLPERIAAGAFILHSGLNKLTAEEDRAEGIRRTAKGAYPFVENLEPLQLTRALGLLETALGATLLLPAVGDGLAGLALTGFSGSLLGLYARAPGLRREGSLWPSQQGTAFAKDIWLFGIGLGLVADSILNRRRRHRSD